MEATDATAAPKAKRVKRDLPPGILFNAAKDKYQARIKGENDKGKYVQINRPIPGLFATVDKAVEAQSAAQLQWAAGDAVWPAPPRERNARGEVRAAALHASPSPLSDPVVRCRQRLHVW